MVTFPLRTHINHIGAPWAFRPRTCFRQRILFLPAPRLRLRRSTPHCAPHNIRTFSSCMLDQYLQGGSLVGGLLRNLRLILIHGPDMPKSGSSSATPQHTHSFEVICLPCHATSLRQTCTNAGTSSIIKRHPHPFLQLSWLPWRIHCHTSGKESRSTRTRIDLPWNAITHTSTTAHVCPVCILSVIKLQCKSCSCVGLKECHRKVLGSSHRFLKHPDGVPICGLISAPLPPPPLTNWEMRGEHHLLNYSHMNNQFDSDSLYADVVHVCVCTVV